MKGSRITAVGLVAAAALWIASGPFPAARIGRKPRRASAPARARRRSCSASPSVETNVVPHSRKLLLSGRTEADKQVVDRLARTNGDA